MNNPRAIIASGALALLLIAVVSRGGGQVASGGTGGTGAVASRGPVTQIGSIFVNGVEYDTTGAFVTINGHSFVDTTGTAGGTVLKEGMQVTLRGSINPDGVTGKATAVSYGRTVFGQVYDVTGTGFTVYGQTVVYDPAAKFESSAGVLSAAAPAWLTEDTVVEVSGLVLDDGSVLATYVKQLSSMPLEWEYVGQVTDVSAAHDYIKVNGGSVGMPAGYDWSAAPIEKGMYVHVHVHLATEPSPSDTSIPAEEVEIVDMDLAGSAGETAEVSGVVTEEAADGSWFVVAGQVVYLSTSTRYEYGSAGDLKVGKHLEAHGSFSGGKLTAQKIEFE